MTNLNPQQSLHLGGGRGRGSGSSSDAVADGRGANSSGSSGSGGALSLGAALGGSSGSASGSGSGGSGANPLFDLAMPKDEVKARLAPIPVYTVANPKNEFVLVAGEVRRPGSARARGGCVFICMGGLLL